MVGCNEMSVIQISGPGARAGSDEESCTTVSGGRRNSSSSPDAGETSSSQVDGGNDLRPHETFREKLHRLLHSHRFHVSSDGKQVGVIERALVLQRIVQ